MNRWFVVLTGVLLLTGCLTMAGAVQSMATDRTVSARVGIWVAEDNADEVLQVLDDGSYRLYRIVRRFGIYEIVALGTASARGDGLLLSDTFGTEACPRGAEGHYRAAVHEGDLLLTRIQDTCVERATCPGPARRFRSHPEVAGLVGIWLSEDGSQVAVFGRDLTYELYPRTADVGVHAVEAGIYWPDDGALRLATDGEGSLHCGSLAHGLYAADLTEDGVLTLLSEKERCDRRRVVLEGHRFRRADATEALTGLWRPEYADSYRLRIHRDAIYELFALAAEEPVLLAQGRIWLADGELRLEDIGGPRSCPAMQQGVYEIRADGDRLALTAREDVCQRRARQFAEHPHWLRLPPAR